MKTWKRILLFLAIVAGVFIVAAGVVLKTHEVRLQDSDLPQEVYETDGDLLAIAELKLVALLALHPDDPGERVEEFLNYVLLDMIHEKFNPHYDPLDPDCDSDACNLIYGNDGFYVDYAFVSLTEEDQILLTVGIGSRTLLGFRSAVYLYFDVEIRYLQASVVLSLDRCFLASTEISKTRLSWLAERAGKEEVEDSVPFGTLDLDSFTFTVSLLDF